MGDLTEAIQHRLLPSPVTAHRSNGNPSPMAIKAESWAVAEKEAERIISQCQPTVVSEKKRRDVIDYVQRLIRGYLGCEVFPYGSVPLKTYLPDGDIDLTAFGGANEEEVLADDIVSVLEAEEQNRAAEFIIKDVQLVRAEVKLVKCIVQNIVVDISFNQIGGLCTLCFLEQVDRLIGKNHLFKRSIILIKAWCYYQSRILGAHHGLISTYALETLVLYIFHVFHSTLDGPLAVLYKFLDYFSNFDWETYCISLTGPVRISSLPDIIVETPENGCGDLLLGSDFLRYCSHMFAVPLRDADLNSKTFPQKFLNIVDPLKENNNLGRSVSKGNFCRIRSAFAYGARKLGQILTHRVVDIAEELCIFFSSALDRHGSGLRADVQNSIPRSALSVYASAYSILDAKMEAKPCQYNNGSVQDIVENDAVVEVGIAQNGRQTSFVDGVFLLEDEKRRDRNGFPGNRLTGKANDISTSSFGGLKISNDTPKNSPNHEEIGSALHMKPHAPHLYFSKSRLSNQTAKNVDFDTNQSENLENKISSVMKDNVPSIICSKSNELDLSGDYDSYLTCLHYGRWWYKYVSSILVVTMPPPPPTSPFPGVSLWDPVLLPSQFKRNGFSHGNVNDFIQSSVVYPMNQMLISGVAVGSEEMTKHRGTGTYFPKQNRPPNGYRTSSVKGWNFGRARSSSTKGRFAEANMLEKSNVEQLPQSHFTVDQCLGSDIHQSYSQRLKQNLNANGYISQPEGIAEHGPAVRHMPLRTPNPVSSRQPRLASLNPQTTSHGSPGPNTQMPNHVPGSDRLMVQKSYHLKNEDDFPPLSS